MKLPPWAKNPWLWGGAFVLGAMYMAAKTPRGIRLNNGGNLKKLGGWKNWDGLAPSQPDPVFVAFATPEAGAELLSQVLLNKQVKYGFNTVARIIGDPERGYAPAYDNNPVNEYAWFVSKALGVTPTTPIDLVGREDQHRKFVDAVVAFENRRYRYPAEMIEAAVKRGRRDVLGVA